MDVLRWLFGRMVFLVLEKGKASRVPHPWSLAFIEFGLVYSLPRVTNAVIQFPSNLGSNPQRD